MTSRKPLVVGDDGLPQRLQDADVIAASSLPAFGGADVSFAAGGGAGTIATKAVSYAKIQDASPGSLFIGRSSKASGPVGEIDMPTAKTMLALVVADVPGAAPLANPTFTGNAQISGGYAYLYLNATSGATDTKVFAFQDTGATLDILAVNDTYGGSVTAFSIARSGTTITSLKCFATLLVTTQDAISAAGTDRTTATAITADVSRITTAPGGSGVILPPAVAGAQKTVINSGASDIVVYPATGETINTRAANVGFAVALGGGMATFICPVAGKWFAK